ncbi:MAG: GNAT family N-acetyltransferase, partial [Acinetobacter guillouiae]
MNISLKPLQLSDIDLIWQHIDRRELITQMYLQQKQKLHLVDCFYDVQSWDEYHLKNDPPLLKQ